MIKAIILNISIFLLMYIKKVRNTKKNVYSTNIGLEISRKDELW